jgi:hypothetical protein
VKRRREILRKFGLIAAALAGLWIPALALMENASPRAVETAKAFYKATRAGDSRKAQVYLTAADRQAADLMEADSALGDRQRTGFALALSRQFAQFIEIAVANREENGDRARITLDYKVPAGDELSALLLGGDAAKLNALSGPERRRLLVALRKMPKAEPAVAIEGREIVELRQESGVWRVFLNSAAATLVSFAALLPDSNSIDVAFSKDRLLAGSDEPFQSDITIRNLTKRALVTRIDHRIEPEEHAGSITMIACGFLRPLVLHPGEKRQVSSAYLLDPAFPKASRLKIGYQFKLDAAQTDDVN